MLEGAEPRPGPAAAARRAARVAEPALVGVCGAASEAWHAHLLAALPAIVIACCYAVARGAIERRRRGRVSSPDTVRPSRPVVLARVAMLIGLCALAAGWWVIPGVAHHQVPNLLGGCFVAVIAAVTAAREARNVRTAPWRF